MRPTTDIEKKFDRSYQRSLPLTIRLIVKLFRGTINKVASTAVNRAFERSQINSYQMHEIYGILNDLLWPDRLTYVAEKLETLKTGSSDGVTCNKCGGYVPGHATGAADICTCKPITVGK